MELKFLRSTDVAQRIVNAFSLTVARPFQLMSREAIATATVQLRKQSEARVEANLKHLMRSMVRVRSPTVSPPQHIALIGALLRRNNSSTTSSKVGGLSKLSLSQTCCDVFFIPHAGSNISERTFNIVYKLQDRSERYALVVLNKLMAGG